MKKGYTKSAQDFNFCKKKFIHFALIILLCLYVWDGAAQITYTWLPASTDWQVPTNWTPTRTTLATNDILVFNTGAAYTITNIPTETIGQLLLSGNTTVNLQAEIAGNILTVSGAAGDDLIVSAGSSLNINGTSITTIMLAANTTGNITGGMAFSSAPHRLNATDASAINFNSPAIFTQYTGCTGSVFTTTGTANAIVFNIGTVFIQNAGGNPFGLTQPASKVVFNTGSLFKIQQNVFFSTVGRTYANLEINSSSFNQNLTGGGGPLTADDIIITQGQLNLDLTGGINIKGNITVQALQTLAFNPVSLNTLTFNGTFLQSITNSGTLTFGSNEAVSINNAAGIVFNNNITFNNLVSFISGIITITNPNILSFGVNGSVAGASDASFVNGEVSKTGNTSFIFPVGDVNGPFSGYVPIGISAPAAIGDTYTAAYNRSSAIAISTNYLLGLDHISGVDYWTLNRTSGTSAVDVTLYWTVQSSANGSALYINDISKLVIAHYNSGITKWDIYGATGNSGGFTAGSITWVGVNEFGPFSLGSTNTSNPLPINLNYLNAAKQGYYNNLNWKVTCTNNSNVIMSLERSGDGRNFTGLTTITADALRCQQPFNYNDISPVKGINYYRLKITDTYGKVTYSSIITIINKETGFEITGLLPNFVTNTAILNVSAAQKMKMDILITDVTGKQVQKIACNLITGGNQVNLNLTNFRSGIYQIIGYTAEGKSRTLRFVKQ
jgi:hypothetical protein